MGVTIESNWRVGLAEAKAALTGTTSDTVQLQTLDLMSQAIQRAPVEEGTLRGSSAAHFDGVRIAASDYPVGAKGEPATPLSGGDVSGSLKGTVTFNTLYAAAQHERTDYVHPKGGEAKYLERPLEENRARYFARLVAALRRELRG